MAVERTRGGNAAIVHGGLRPVIEEDHWSTDGRLTLRGRYPAAATDAFEAVLRRRGSTDQHVVGFSRDGERFSVEIDVASMPSFAQPLPLRDGNWDVFVRRAGAASAGLITPVYDHARLARITGDNADIGPKNYRFTTSGYDAPLIVVRPTLKLSELGRFQRQMLRSVVLPAAAETPAAGLGRLHQLEGQAVRRQPARHRRGAAPPRR